jgi:MYXO-CTERM domain-containing protein
MPLAAYLTGAVGSTFLVTAPQAEAAVTAVTFGFGSVLSSSSAVYGDTTTTPDFGSVYATSDGIGPTAIVRLGNDQGNGGKFYQQSAEGFGIASFLANGAIVGSGNNGTLGMAYFASTFPDRTITTNQLNKNIGFRTSRGNFGWANVSWDATAKALTFHSAYVESRRNTPIIVPEPSRALLALAGFGAVALRRRRRQAA